MSHATYNEVKKQCICGADINLDSPNFYGVDTREIALIVFC